MPEDGNWKVYGWIYSFVYYIVCRYCFVPCADLFTCAQLSGAEFNTKLRMTSFPYKCMLACTKNGFGPRPTIPAYFSRIFSKFPVAKRSCSDFVQGLTTVSQNFY